MKKLIIITLLLFNSCTIFETYNYQVQVTYINGDVENIYILDSPKLRLYNGSLMSGHKTMRSGVRNFIVMNTEIYK